MPVDKAYPENLLTLVMESVNVLSIVLGGVACATLNPLSGIMAAAGIIVGIGYAVSSEQHSKKARDLKDRRDRL